MSRYLSFIRHQWPLLAFGFLTVFWGNLGQSFFLSWYGAEIQQSLSLSASEYGFIYALATLGSGVVIMLLGGMIDGWPLARFTTAVALALMLAALSMVFVNTTTALIAGFFLLRLAGQGLMPHTAQTTMVRYFEAGRGKAISLAASGVPVGEMLLPAVAVALIAALGWQHSWLVLALSIPVLYLPLAHWLLRRSDPQLTTGVTHTGTAASAAGGRRHLLGDWRFWCILPAVLAGPFMVTGIFIQQGFILAQKGWSPAWLASCFIAYGVIHWSSSMVTGGLVDRFRARRLLPFITLPLCLALLCLAWLDSRLSALLFMALLGCSMGFSNPVVGALWAEVYGTNRIGAIRSLMTALMMFSTAAAPWLFGLLIDLGLNDLWLFNGAAALVLFAGLLVLPAYPVSFSPSEQESSCA